MFSDEEDLRILFWRRVFSGLFLASDFHHFSFEDIALLNPEGITAIVVIQLCGNLEQAQVSLRIQEGKSAIKVFELDYSKRPKITLIAKDISFLKRRLRFVHDKTARIFTILHQRR